MGGVVVAPPCLQNRADCFAWTKGKCACLNDTKFGRKKCPFYKPEKQRRAELKEREGR